MTSDISLQLMSQMLWAAILIAGPVLLLIQDASLAITPEMLSAFLVLILFGPWMLKNLVKLCSFGHRQHSIIILGLCPCACFCQSAHSQVKRNTVTSTLGSVNFLILA